MGSLKKAGTALILAVLLFTPARAETFDGLVNTPDINVRADSTPNSEIVCVLKKGDRVSVVKELYDWYKIRLPKNAPSYVKKNLLECLPEDLDVPAQTPVPLKEKACHSAKVAKDNVNIRLNPSENARILGKLNKNTIVSVLGEEGGWCKIEPQENSFAWVHKKFINEDAAKTAVIPEQKIIKSTTVNILKTDITLEGTVQPYGMIFKRQATHKLTSPEHGTWLLKGNKSGLDALNYRKVKVTGKIIPGTKEKYPVIEITSLEALN
jgi:uncharacterized protein YgiM (DUF1202 family)